MSSAGVGIADLKGVSLRGRMAFAISSLEAAVAAVGAEGTPWEDFRERLWRCVVAPPSEWYFARMPHNLADLDALFPEVRPARWDEARDVLRQVFFLAGETRSRILAEPIRGYCDGSHDAVRSLVILLRRERIPEPSIDAVARSPFSESSGWGRPMPPAFFRDGVQREGFESSLRTALEHGSIHRAREAAHALCHLGLPSDLLLQALKARVARRTDDLEIRYFAGVALEQYGANLARDPDAPCARWPNVPSAPTMTLSPSAEMALAEKAAATVVDFLSRDVAVRARAVDRASTLFGVFPGFVDNLVRFLAEDGASPVRASAAASLANAPVSEQVVTALTSGTRDPHVAVRAAAARSLGRMGPAAAASVPALLTLMGDRTAEIDTTEGAFEASEAIEEIGMAAVPVLVDEALRGDEERRALCVRKLLQVEDMRRAACTRLAASEYEIARDVLAALTPTPPPR